MNYPSFFNSIEPISLEDPLADILGAFEEGRYSISYVEVVKGAGHSCPTVAGAYLMTQYALKALYPNEPAIRGDIEVFFKEQLQEGVAGVIGNVVSYITGATDQSGFKGLGGKFARHSLMHFESEIGSSSARFSSCSKNKSVDVFYDPSSIKPHPDMQPLMQLIMQNKATPEQKRQFGLLWQERVKNIFAHADEVIRLQPVNS